MFQANHKLAMIQNWTIQHTKWSIYSFGKMKHVRVNTLHQILSLLQPKILPKSKLNDRVHCCVVRSGGIQTLIDTFIITVHKADLLTTPAADNPKILAISNIYI